MWSHVVILEPQSGRTTNWVSNLSIYQPTDPFIHWYFYELTHWVLAGSTRCGPVEAGGRHRQGHNLHVLLLLTFEHNWLRSNLDRVATFFNWCMHALDSCCVPAEVQTRSTVIKCNKFNNCGHRPFGHRPQPRRTAWITELMNYSIEQCITYR